MIEQIATQVEEEIGHDDGCDIRPSAFFQVQSYVVIVWNFLPSFPFFIGLFRCGDVLSSPLSHPCISYQIGEDTRVVERRRQNKDEDTSLGILVGQKQGQEGRARLWAEQEDVG